ncbi:undecaprenyl pyrophosphate synthetase [Alkalibaculum bacchi]|uniref:Isoprenyl transferase n=1 Tax=Alkalibaculum bacchi TaxID=645887 RepID=A0A366HZR7_9FIRM|nr:isoprenyl transferase [Alkalibaculum bacchi]RBP59955.1 undecaprenyl pyrophosphate synthetase [Alkalibaculum bacchi]
MAYEAEIDKKNLPKHIAIIMDGNGRWAKKRFQPRLFGHRAGIESLREIIQVSSDLGIKALTVYAFSTENWKRPKSEVDGLMKMLIEYFNKEIDELNRNNVKIRILGERSALSKKVKSTIEKAERRTEDNRGLIFNVAINYGGRDEIIQGIKALYQDMIMGKYSIEDLNEDLFTEYLFTEYLEDPDLIIRTSGEVRMSNFLIWQSAYSELYFTDILWPDFKKEDYYDAICDYQKRKRKFGGIIV